MPSTESSTKLQTNSERLITRRFTQSGVPWDCAWEKRESKITDPDGSVVFQSEAEVPSTFSQLATDIATSKYFRKAGVAGGGEVSFKQVVFRVANTIRKAGESRGYFSDLEEADAFEAELTYMLTTQVGAFNSPVWFNCGLWQQYGIKGGAGLWAYNESYNPSLNGQNEHPEVMRMENAYERPQSSACFIQSVDDDLRSIYDLAKNEAMLFKYGSGTGSNMSYLRSKYEKLSGGGLSSGLISFLEMLDRVAGSTKSGGTTRRAAVMRCLDMDHPEIVDFIEWKSREEKKAKALIAAGWPSDFNGEAYRTVSGQNSNNSVRVTEEFMRKVQSDGDWSTLSRTTGEVVHTYKARDLWNKIAEAAWQCADPGLQFDTTINEWHTCSNTAKIRASNPCSEFMFLDESACNLASLNLTKFLQEDGTFDVEAYRHAIRVFLLAQEILVDFSSYPTERLCKTSHDYRPLGLGYANLGTLLMVSGVPYDSDKGRAIAGSLTAILTGHAYKVSAQIAAKRGPFAGYVKNKEPMLQVIGKHRSAVAAINHGITGGVTHTERAPNYLIQAAQQDWDDALRLGEQYGYRNSQTTVLAPTGTIGLLMDCDTTGIEPDFSLVKYKKLAGGGTIKIVNQSVTKAIRNLKFSEDDIRSVLTYVEQYDTVEGCPLITPSMLPIFDCANRCGKNGTRYLAPMSHVLMMAAAQPFLSGAISKTVNLPNESTVEEIKGIYERSWSLGLKAVALYRDGCKSSQPLNSQTDKEVLAKASEVAVKSPAPEVAKEPVQRPTGSRVRLPTRRSGITQEARVGGHKVFLRTGEYEDGSIGEIFIDMHKEGATFRSIMNCLAMSVSLGLQHGVPLASYVRQFTFTKFEPSGPVLGHAKVKLATSVVDYVFRSLAVEYLGREDLAHVKSEAYVADETPKGPTEAISADQHHAEMMGDAPACDGCGHITVRNGTCYRCLNCGDSMGCS